ncbi:DedA family protein [uncultured Desulfobacterium sp.]|uniref:DedA family protein n=1 Tax=uncultured Desulfobacterium sp. TaxID=201089 RepID=A0A445N3Y3_9BACT|nr:DedA family protein [uncultured Desulfobacterium sp.]
MSIEQLIDTYGYLAVLIGTFLEGETVLVFAGFAAHRGYLHLDGVIISAFFGSLCGDQLFFFLGRWHSQKLMKKHPSWHVQVDRIQAMMERFRSPFILVFRFLYGLRTIAPFAIGMSSVPISKFILLNAIGAIGWACAVGAGGYFLGNVLETIIGDIKEYETHVFLGIAIIGLIVWILYFFSKKRREKKYGKIPLS